MAEKLDTIRIRNLKCRCIVGINPDERVKRQDVVVNLTLYADLSAACASDNIDDTVDYKRVKNAVLAMVETSEYFLVERLVDEIAKVCLNEPLVQAVRVSLDKPGALRFAKSVSVEIHRTRNAK